MTSLHTIKFIRIYQSAVAQAGVPQYRIECTIPGFPHVLGYATREGRDAWRADAVATQGGQAGRATTRYDATQAMIRTIERHRDDAARAKLAEGAQ